MRPIRTRILCCVLVCILISNILVMLMGILNISHTIKKESNQMILQLAQEKAQEVNAQLHLIEQSVLTLHEFISDEAGNDPAFWQEADSSDNSVTQLHNLAELTLRNTPGALCVYFHMTDQSDGFYLIQKEDGICIDFPLADGHAPSFEQAADANGYSKLLKKGRPGWLTPYQNPAVDREVLSYLSPIVCADQSIGIIGMDIDLSLIRDQVRTVDLYEDAYAVVLDKAGNFVYHPDYPEGLAKADFPDDLEAVSHILYIAEKSMKVSSYRLDNQNRKVAMQELNNDMYVGVIVPSSQARQPAGSFAAYTIAIVLAVIGIFCVVSLLASSAIVKPLQDLTDSAQKLANGDFDVAIKAHTNDEVQDLAESLKHTANALKEHVNSLNEFARTDPLTHINNKSSYQEHVQLLTEQITAGTAAFSVALLDVNSLKHMNDTYGHEIGDLWITAAAAAMEHAFGHSRVYRIGGDEFAVLLTLEDRAEYEQMLAEFYREIDRFNRQEEKPYSELLQVACGIADYQEGTDLTYADVFRKADEAMYENKQHLKNLLHEFSH